MQENDNAFENLLIKVANGDQKAFAKIYEIFYPALLKHTASKVGELAIAEDILHDLFLSLWNTRERLNDIGSLQAYLYTSCRYLTIQHFKNAARKEMQDNLQKDTHEDLEKSIEDRLYYRYLLDIVNSEIDNLPEKCKQVFKLSREQFKSNKEIALLLNISESTVENQINKALKRIRNATSHLLLWYLFSQKVVFSAYTLKKCNPRLENRAILELFSLRSPKKLITENSVLRAEKGKIALSIMTC